MKKTAKLTAIFTFLIILPFMSTNAFADLMQSVNLNPHPMPESIILLFFGVGLICVGGYFKKSFRV